MNNSEIYEMINNGEGALPSNMAVIPATSNFNYEFNEVEKSLKQSKLFEALSFTAKENTSLHTLWEAEIEIKYLGDIYTISLYMDDMEEVELDSFGLGNRISETEFQAAKQQKYMAYTSMYFNEDVLTSFHLQLKVLHAIIPQAALVIDFMPYRLLSGQWLQITAQSAVPPSPEYLYTIHGVYDGEEEDKRIYWLHTHGLHRCGTVELEMLNIGKGVYQVNNLLNTAAQKFISDPQTEGESFRIGYDGMDLSLCWKRWEDVIDTFPENIPGGKKDRQEEGDIHTEPSGVLFAVEDGMTISPEIYAQTMEGDPLLFFSEEETERMSRMAKERFNHFTHIFSKHKNDEDWSFLIKLGYKVDNAEKETDREHLWFMVSNIKGNEVEAELINDPYWVSQLKKGDKGTHNLGLLTDWIIYSPIAADGQYTPDSVYQFYLE